MQAPLFWQGIVFGFSIAAPVGPIGILCIRRTLTAGRWAGFVSGLGAATADAFYGCIAGLGLAALSESLLGWQMPLRLVGGALLLALGVRTFLTPPAQKQAAARERAGLIGAYLSTLLLTLTNPVTILAFLGLFAAADVVRSARGGGTVALLVAGVFCGSALWWLTLSGVVGVLRGRLNRNVLHWVNRLSGVIIIGFGLWALAGALG